MTDTEQTGSGVHRIAQLREQLKAQRRARTESVERMKECAARAAEGTPADNQEFKLEADNDLPDKLEGKVKLSLLKKTHQARKHGLEALKQTTLMAVRQVRPTEYLDPEKVRAALGDPPPETPGNGASGNSALKNPGTEAGQV